MMSAPISPITAQNFNIDPPSDVPLLPTTLVNGATEEMQTTSSDTPSEHDGPEKESELFATEGVLDHAQTVEETTTSSKKSTASAIDAQSRSHTSNKSTKSAISSPKSNAPSTKYPRSVTGSVLGDESTSNQDNSRASSTHSQPDETDEVETYGGNEDIFEVFKPKVIQLCRDIGWGEPDEVEAMEGGSFNQVIGLHFNNPEQRLILRMPSFPFLERMPYEIHDQVGILSYLSQFNELHVPRVLAYDSTTENTIGNQWVVQSRLPGSSLQDVFYKLPIQEKLELTTLVAESIIKMSNIRLPKPGRLVGPRQWPKVSHFPPNRLANIDIRGYREYPIDDPPVMEQQPFAASMISLFKLRNEKKQAGKDEMHQRLQEITLEMEKAGLMRVHDLENVLWHWDFAARNILVQKVEVENGGANGLDAGCHHSFQVSLDEKSGYRHSIEVKVDDASNGVCKHKVTVNVEDNNGRTIRHQVEIKGKEATPCSSNHSAKNSIQHSSQQNSNKQSSKCKSKGRWTISGVIDWDETESVPLVIARNPHSWLWLDEQERGEFGWRGENDEKPHRDLTNDELLIKSHFDQIMARNSPTYMEDTYGRGIWLRRLSRFARRGFTDNEDWKRFDKFDEDWTKYYKNLGCHGVDAIRGGKDGGEESGNENGEEGNKGSNEETRSGNEDAEETNMEIDGDGHDAQAEDK